MYSILVINIALFQSWIKRSSIHLSSITIDSRSYYHSALSRTGYEMNSDKVIGINPMGSIPIPGTFITSTTSLGAYTLILYLYSIIACTSSSLSIPAPHNTLPSSLRLIPNDEKNSW